MTQQTNPGPLAGVRILDLSSVVMGPYATQVLGDLGADIIKVEPPTGDNLRAVGPMRNPGMGYLHLHLNRNKRSIVLDLKQPAGRQACLKLAEGCDALLYNIRPQAMARLGLDYETVSACNPRLVYVGAYGYSEAGPYAGRPAYDDLIQGQTGIADLAARQSGELPRYAPLTLADRSVGLHVAIALLSGVLRARADGQGQAIEVSMFEGMAHMVLGDHLGGHSFEPPLGPTGYARLLAPHRRPYATADGYISLLIYNDKHWRNFFDLIGQPELAADPRFRDHTQRARHIDEVYAFVAEVIRRRDSASWLRDLETADIPASRLYSIDDLIADPHLRQTGFVREVDHPSEGRLRTTAPLGRYARTPAALRRGAPRLGEHSRELLREAGLDEKTIDTLMAQHASLDGQTDGL
ncbi:CaiB/BaiF CoA transferase family protein [Bordetella pseudohinzii]|uniref:Acetyl-CoA acetyltransferase n=1 Tax=Bordetella pseudohinzii TaxID=1331258 RepID=A0A0J6C1D2_9BORD|nr:CoA transferase [Bordetella pseudohinzii]ANY16016.1 acetyl-CoA acetyltransferase [Bordetella pseudohinzii]KMM24591.1 acetyl-CoA acetyltransferase [Bordetella pseudohinzii]KXA75130.1 acetyl-CoA acetyltransferase [Bordetella pseudohinzii]KXA75541.1 acetyl-CoA acetyltransferase [Bordetella pseudohinzii]CUJ09134.1 Formyl-coenzyme A transferase [Bordetella pseudohinzii]